MSQFPDDQLLISVGFLGDLQESKAIAPSISGTLPAGTAM
jgi:hypothetical protein